MNFHCRKPLSPRAISPAQHSHCIWFWFCCWFWGSNLDPLLVRQVLHSPSCSPPSLALFFGISFGHCLGLLPMFRLWSSCPALLLVACPFLSAQQLWPQDDSRILGTTYKYPPASPRTSCLKQPTCGAHGWDRPTSLESCFASALWEVYKSPRGTAKPERQSVPRKVGVPALSPGTSTVSIPGWFCHRIL